MHSLKEIFTSKMKEVVEENNVNNDFKVFTIEINAFFKRNIYK